MKTYQNSVTRTRQLGVPYHCRHDPTLNTISDPAETDGLGSGRTQKKRKKKRGEKGQRKKKDTRKQRLRRRSSTSFDKEVTGGGKKKNISVGEAPTAVTEKKRKLGVVGSIFTGFFNFFLSSSCLESHLCNYLYLHICDMFE